MKNLPKALFILLFLLWMLPGLIGRDPWKADEPYSFSMTSHIMRTGDATVPMVAGVPFLEKPPLYYVSAAVSGWVFSPLLAPHDAVRLVNLVWMFLTLLFLGLATSEIAGRETAWTAPVLLIGCTLLQMPAHKLVTDNALLTGFAVAYYGLAISRRLPGWGGIWTGTGIGIGFLSKGLFAPGMIGMTALALPIVFPAWRRKEYTRALAIAAIAALPWVVIWPAALYARSPDYFMEWFWYQNLGRFFGFSRVGGHESHVFPLINLPWLAWPVLPLALWALWRFRGKWREQPLYQLPLTAAVVMLIMLTVSASARYLYALPMLLPFTILAAAGVGQVPARPAAVIGRTSVVLFSALGLALWLGWLMRITGIPFLAATLPLNTVHYQPLDPLLIGAALLITALWLAGLRRLFRKDTIFPLSWTAGIVVVWGLAMTLWLPWFEGETSFRDVFTSLRDKLPGHYQCVASYGLGESERAMLEYYAGIRVRPLESTRMTSCDLLILGSGRDKVDAEPIDRWRIAWDGVRPQDRPKEHYSLYHLAPAPTGPVPGRRQQPVRAN